ncbi:hypothetical protein J18TS1_35200 [Oceanobacillus oncorhynchi subsp. incaldanensis]|uniref:Uncharacterized protein n=1 Tax=Oceanobacillus aidingensis TaxID=645964 RepID=A0ABV9K3Y5_9BACI|nr:hypothetical protein [Oceanobacillus oncorhynchi]MDM8099781.1 hypothetical protein [Oceanobacillus oncorhynchi]GIO20420.1 hypothetical protein J18TS1_35200 [Oceanobacillus oncorhynchi subsp. incaldanensis]
MNKMAGVCVRQACLLTSMLEKSKEKYGKLFQGFEPVSSKRIGLAYRKSVFGAQTGQAYKVY